MINQTVVKRTEESKSRRKLLQGQTFELAILRQTRDMFPILKMEHGMKVHLPPMIRLQLANVQAYFSMHRHVLKE